MNRDQAYAILIKYITNPNLIKHCLAAEASMKALYKYIYNQPATYNPHDEEKWGITGLLHDADYEISKGHPEKHGLMLFEKENVNQFPDDVAHAIKAHNWEYTKIQPQNTLDWAIACADQLTGLIVAAALITPEKKLANITPEFVLNRMNDKSFAKGAIREPIKLCEEKLNIPLNEFVAIVLKSMQNISTQLGL